MTQVLLDQLKRHAVLEQVRGVGVAERVDVGAFVNAALLERTVEGLLQAVAADRAAGCVAARRNARLQARREEPDGVAVRPPVLAQE